MKQAQCWPLSLNQFDVGKQGFHRLLVLKPFDAVRIFLHKILSLPNNTDQSNLTKGKSPSNLGPARLRRRSELLPKSLPARNKGNLQVDCQSACVPQRECRRLETGPCSWNTGLPVYLTQVRSQAPCQSCHNS